MYCYKNIINNYPVLLNTRTLVYSWCDFPVCCILFSLYFHENNGHLNITLLCCSGIHSIIHFNVWNSVPYSNTHTNIHAFTQIHMHTTLYYYLRGLSYSFIHQNSPTHIFCWLCFHCLYEELTGKRAMSHDYNSYHMCVYQRRGGWRKGGFGCYLCEKEVKKGEKGSKTRTCKREREESGVIEDLLRNRGRAKVTEY